MEAPATRLAVLLAKAPRPTPEATTSLARILRALGDPTRLSIAAMLARQQDALCVCHIESRFDLSQPTISHHLRVLREVRLVRSERRGGWVYYELDSDALLVLPSIAALLESVELAAAPREGCCT